jgi:hypothetical protein
MGPDLRGFEHGKAYAATLLVAGCASVVACGLAAQACITAPPPDLPVVQSLRPTVLHDAVQPPEGPLFEWPVDNTFLVPVELDVPNEAFVFAVFVDYGGGGGAGPGGGRRGA